MAEKTHIKVDAFIDQVRTWQEEYKALRSIILQTELDEDFKWMHPCYTLNGKNVVLIHSFKDYIALLFHKGALLVDDQQQLVRQTENVQAARQLRFKDIEDIHTRTALIHAYIKGAIEVEKSGKRVVKKKHDDYEIPEELQVKFNEVEGLEDAFTALTPGRQRAYLLHIGQAKQSKTRTARVEKYIDAILQGKGMND
ncbi:hypothetical protein ERX37_06935 [Macrococcus hajekii]|uniref:YdhG-like domain-containing protein n=1 Tax=Macrococcus hajekii TaxID=198482 RepID=A0A4R6BJQ2_9STAP|nr:YdeI/OmpD-associated family protein [Macrococcus hajekii]TDM01939.1 hypothetical protein ERX37_06935 [Macrococcus hajekii]GGB08706.1 hypothetical protein GCM10007190_15900 [Macrococcus hajekii]